MKYNKRAFTLIELLVVVLIIGILSAIALPQYQTAVLKSRFTGMMPVLRAIKDAQERYYLANGKYALYLVDLDVSLPGNCTQAEAGNLFICGTEWRLDNGVANGDTAMGQISFSYCPGHTSTYDACTNNRYASLIFYFDHHPYKPGQHECGYRNNSSIGIKVCKAFTGWNSEDEN